MYIHVYIRSGALVGVQCMCVWSAFVCVHTLHSSPPRRPAGSGSLNWTCWKALGTGVTWPECFPRLIRSCSTFGTLVFRLPNCPLLPIQQQGSSSISATKSTARYQSHNHFQVRPAFIHCLVCSLLWFVSLKGGLISKSWTWCQLFFHWEAKGLLWLRLITALCI